MKIRYLGHSAIEITVETAGANTVVLVDPFITGNPQAEAVVTVDELRPDYILLTHAHADHWGDTPAIATQCNAIVVANHEIVTYLERKHHYDNTVGMNIGGSVVFDWGTVTQTYARHSSSFPNGAYGGNPNGYLIEADGRVVYILGDTAAFAEMEWIGKAHSIDVAFVPIGDRYTMGPTAACQAVSMIAPALAIPVHFNTFPVIEADPEEWIRDLEKIGRAGRVMRPAETIMV